MGILIKAMGAVAFVALAAAPSAVAQELDPHMPNGGSLWCHGGLGNNMLIPYCNGLKYPDGSYWHQEAASPFGFGGPAGLPWKEPVLMLP